WPRSAQSGPWRLACCHQPPSSSSRPLAGNQATRKPNPAEGGGRSGGAVGGAAPLPGALGGLLVAAAAELVPALGAGGDPPAMQQVQGEGRGGWRGRGRWAGRGGSVLHPMASSRLVVREAGTGRIRPGLTASDLRRAGRR